MLKYTWIFLILTLGLTSCTTEFNEEVGGYKPVTLDSKFREERERLKREFLHIEDLKIGNGPVAAWGRKITADVIIRYVGDGSLAYQGPVLAYWGMDGSVFIHNSLGETGALSLVGQPGILLGLNGMAVGGSASSPSRPS
ncbi:MAG: hypothetical protein IT389_15225 [Nitrospira sp.]|nr:hypothetical protein [Nitrospira sp.]